jgi:hypothetical protein
VSLLQSITIKPLLYVTAALAVSLLLSNVGWWVNASTLRLRSKVANAEKDAALVTLDARTTERDAWKRKVVELHVANVASQQTTARLLTELANAQGERRRIQAEGQRAITAALAEAADADRTLKAFVDRYAKQVSAPDCAGALAAVQRACPALEGY